MLWEQFIGLSLKAMRTLVIRTLQGYRDTVSFSYPDTWAGKPNCLHLIYPFWVPHFTICEDVFHKGPLVRSAEPRPHNPQQQYRLQKQASETEALLQQQNKL